VRARGREAEAKRWTKIIRGESQWSCEVVRVKKEEEVRGGEAKKVGVSATELERYVKGLEELRALRERS
jgi:hypothetical protein